MFTWPETLPADLVLGHGEDAPGNVASFEPMVGAAVLHQTGDTRARQVSGKLRISDTQRVTFLAFYEETLRMGTRRFSLLSSAFDGETWLCQFNQPGAYSLESAAAGWWLGLSLVLVRRLD